MKKPNQTLRNLGFGRSIIQYHAHALTMFAVFWSLPSGILLFVFFTDHERRPDFHATPGSIASLCALLAVPVIHLCSIVAAIYYWCTERKQKVIAFKTSGEVSADL